MREALISVRVARKVVEATDICSFELVPISGESLPPFSAGAHVDVHIREGVVRQYSLCNHSDEKHRYQIAVLRDAKSRGGSIAMHEEIREGSILRISNPKNHFALAHGAERSLLFAGGIGVTPILCMAQRLASIGGEFEMHYCTRSRDRTAFIGRIEESGFSARVRFHFDDGDPAQRLDLMDLIARPVPKVHIYVCGPGPFIDWVTGTARSRGWPNDQVHVEFFKVDLQPEVAAETFEVQLASSGKCYVVPPDTSVLQVLLDNGIEIQSSCEQGVCGTCMTRVLEGVPDHRDVYLTEEEHARNDRFTPCCSRSKSAKLILDI